MIRRLAVIGVGLIGGSLALALRRAGYCQEVVGSSRDAQHMRRAVELGVIDRFDTDPAQAVAGADMVVLAVPLGAMATVWQAIHGELAADTVVTDVGSAKASVVAAVREGAGALPANFVPGHPIAGNERSGVGAASADLFQGRRVILTPLDNTDPWACARVQAMWEAAGALVEALGLGDHDEILAATSHLPHLLAFALVDSLAGMGERDEIFRYAAGGFRDFTRIASSDPVMWRDICLANGEALLQVLDRYQAELAELRERIAAHDGAALLEVFQRSKAARDRFCD